MMVDIITLHSDIMAPENKYKLVKGDKKRLARALRAILNIPARTICRTMKNQQIIDLLY